MKKIGYMIFALFFYVFRLFGVKEKKVFCIMTHDSSKGSSVGVVVEELKKQQKGYEFYYLKKQERDSVKQHALQKFWSFFLVKSYHLATSSVIMLDNIFLPMAYLKFAPNVKVVQLWHGTGTIKKFGQDVNEGELKKLEYKANQTITHLIVNSAYTKRQFGQAFGVEADKVFAWGLPRTDEMFSDEIRSAKEQHFYEEYVNLKGKKLVLYAPTFRDDEVDNPQLKIDFKKLVEETDESIVYLLKLHPFVASRFTLTGVDEGRVINVSSYKDINTLLFVSDILITDYSSIIFEYCVLEKPMIFYAYDLEKFSKDGRGFYEPYENYVPGPVAKNTDDLVSIIAGNKFNQVQIVEFKKNSYQYLDGKSMDRLVRNIFKTNSKKY